MKKGCIVETTSVEWRASWDQKYPVSGVQFLLYCYYIDYPKKVFLRYIFVYMNILTILASFEDRIHCRRLVYVHNIVAPELHVSINIWKLPPPTVSIRFVLICLLKQAIHWQNPHEAKSFEATSTMTESPQGWCLRLHWGFHYIMREWKYCSLRGVDIIIVWHNHFGSGYLVIMKLSFLISAPLAIQTILIHSN